MHLVAKFVTNPIPDGVNRVTAIVEHPSGSTVHLSGKDLTAAEALVDEYYFLLMSCDTTDDFFDIVLANPEVSENVEKFVVPENPTLDDILTDAAGAFAEGSE